MIFITKIELENFQSHKISTLELDRGLNVIVGNSDSGKTAILRAIRWVLYNEPSGDQFIKQGETYANATLYFNTGAIIKRFRSTSKNTYYLKRSTGEEFNFDGFGVNVPKEISDEVSIVKIKLDNSTDDSINIAQQLDGPFLLNEKTSLRSSAIGRLVGVNFIDDAHRQTIKDNKQILSNLKILSQKKDNLLEEIKKYDYIKEKEIILKKIKEIKNLILTKQENLNLLSKYNNDFINLNINIDNINSKLKNFVKLEDLEKNINVLNNKVSIFSNLNNLNNKFIDINKNINLDKNLLFKLDKLDDLDDILKNIKSCKDNYDILKSLNDKYLQNKLKITYTNEKLNNLKNVENIENIEKRLKKDIQIYMELENLNIKHNKYNKSINIGKQYILKFKNLNIIDNKLIELDKKIDELSKLNSLLSNYKDLNLIIKQLSSKIEHLNKQFKDNFKKYEEKLIKAGHCPICNSEIDSNTIKHLEEHFGGTL